MANKLCLLAAEQLVSCKMNWCHEQIAAEQLVSCRQVGYEQGSSGD
jgi:hypothetical protein